MRIMLRHEEAGNPITATEAVKLARQEIDEDIKEAATRFDLDELQNTNPEFLKKVHSWSLAKTKQKNQASNSNRQGTTRTGPAGSNDNRGQRRDGAKRLDPDENRKTLDTLFGI
jgi:hypothetical protein